MLSTKDIQSSKGKSSKTLSPGNVVAKITSIVLQEQKSNPDAYFLVMNLEGEDMGPEFEGFMYDNNKPELGRAKGQVGRVKFSQYSYKDMTTKTGYDIPRDRQILRDIATLADNLGVRNDLDDIQASDIQGFVRQASRILSNGVFLRWCIAGNAYMKENGMKDYSLHLPKYNKAITTPNFGSLESVITTFNPSIHVEDSTTEAEKVVDSWGKGSEPTAKTNGTSSSSGGSWTPTGFEI
jgi:hypothetical protein